MSGIGGSVVEKIWHLFTQSGQRAVCTTPHSRAGPTELSFSASRDGAGVADCKTPPAFARDSFPCDVFCSSVLGLETFRYTAATGYGRDSQDWRIVEGHTGGFGAAFRSCWNALTGKGQSATPSN